MSDESELVEPAALELTSDERTMAMLAHLLTIGTGFFGPLIILVVKGENSAFVKYHAMQSLIFTGVFSIAFTLIYIFTCGFGVILLLPMLPLVIAMQIYVGIQANNGKWMGYPGLDHLARN